MTGVQTCALPILALAGFEPDVLDTAPAVYRCDCSEERVHRMLRSLGRKEVERLRDEDPHAEVDCQFCDKVYRVDLNDLLAAWPETPQAEGEPETGAAAQE